MKHLTAFLLFLRTFATNTLAQNSTGELQTQDLRHTKEILEQKSVIAPWFGQPGGGIQYKTPVPVRVLESKGLILKF